MALGITSQRWIPFLLLAAIWIGFSLKDFDLPAAGVQHLEKLIPSKLKAPTPTRTPLGSTTNIPAGGVPPSTAPDLASSLSNPDPASNSSKTPVARRPKVLIVFSYSETETARENLKYFIEHGLHDAADFLFILNGETDVAETIPSLENIKVVHRENTCFDLGGIGEVLKKDGFWKSYSRFILINASSRGPFMPYWSDSCWSDLFLAKITDKVKLVGIAGNCWPRFHIPSILWATDDVGMAILLDPPMGFQHAASDVFGGQEDPVGLSTCYETSKQAVHGEIGATAVFLEAGYQVDVMMSSFHKDENYKIYCDTIPPEVQDPLVEGDYFGFSIHPYETVFIRTNRGINNRTIDHLTSWMGGREYSSYKNCKPR